MGFTAIVAGGSGIIGRAIVEHLAQNSDTWSTVHTLSRTQKQEYPQHVKRHVIDLINRSPDKIAQRLKDAGVVADYVFFAAYKEETDEKKACELNGSMLDNFLQALAKSQPTHPVRRIVLTTGGKHYGLHLGPVRLPCVESDPRVDISPNFYYTQEDILEKRCREYGWKWNVCRPNVVQGTVKDNFMNLAVSLCLYASIQKELGEPLWFPGSDRLYLGWDDHSYAPLIAEFEEWVATRPNTANEAFNIVNDDRVTWSRLWPFFSEYFNVPIPKDHFDAPPPLPFRFELPNPAPVAGVAQRAGMPRAARGSVSVDARVSLRAWSELRRVRHAWTRLVKTHRLDPDAFTYATWGFAEMSLGRTWDAVLSMSKARSYGWTGFKDSATAYMEVFQKLETEGVIPPRSAHE